VEAEVRRSVGIGDNLIRLSAGLEDVRDLIDDLDQALARTTRVAEASAEECVA
jgi:cystathionine beta-lyase/cystathionine gamma-synthase